VVFLQHFANILGILEGKKWITIKKIHIIIIQNTGMHGTLMEVIDVSFTSSLLMEKESINLNKK